MAANEFLNLPMVAEDFIDRTLVIYGMSKTHCMTGWRIGFLAGPIDVVKKIGVIQSHSTSCANSIAQIAAVRAIEETPDEEIQAMTKVYEERARFLLDVFAEIGNLPCQAPQSAFYAFPKISSTFGAAIGGQKISSALDLTTALLDQAHLAVVPGEAFGAPDCIRISFATSMSELNRATERLRKFFSALQS